MFFDTPVYFVFLTLVVLIYWRLSRRAQNLFLLAASYFFYGWWDWRFLILIAVSTVVDFTCARIIDRSEAPVRRRLLLALSLSINLGFLGFFKYFNFFDDSFVQLLHTLGIENVNPTLLAIVLPPGISFYTFQEVAYIVDVYNRRMKPAKSLVDYALFISVFPHLIAGPIQRPSHLLPQVQRERTFHPHRFFDGLMLILSGLFRKCVVADNCALLANAAFNGNLGRPSLAATAIGSYAFAWQIYGDFSGYSDIARGSAQLLGFHFMVNFRQPYLATSLQDFWRRWHISLSTWLRDYLYIPLGGNRHDEVKTYRNLLLTMLLGGLWHGANWTYVVWGADSRRGACRRANAAKTAALARTRGKHARTAAAVALQALGLARSYCHLSFGLPGVDLLPSGNGRRRVGNGVVPFRGLLAAGTADCLQVPRFLRLSHVFHRPGQRIPRRRVFFGVRLGAIANRRRLRSDVRLGRFFRKQSQCLHLFPILTWAALAAGHLAIRATSFC